MKPTITIVRRACEAAGARQAVLIAFDREGHFAVVSYGTTREECAAVAPLCDAIADEIGDGILPVPNGARALRRALEVDRGPEGGTR